MLKGFLLPRSAFTLRALSACEEAEGFTLIQAMELPKGQGELLKGQGHDVEEELSRACELLHKPGNAGYAICLIGRPTIRDSGMVLLIIEFVKVIDMALIKRSSGLFQSRLHEHSCYGPRPAPRSRPAGLRFVAPTNDAGVKTSRRETRS